MGCFNINGFFSHAPICHGDRIGAIVCVHIPTEEESIASNFPIGTTGEGYHPIMAPIYGDYNDYGGIENVIENYSSKLFKKISGLSLEEFVEINYRNSATTLETEDNHNRYDDIPGYQAVLRKIVNVPADEEFEKRWAPKGSLANDPEHIKMAKQMAEWEKKRYSKLSVTILYEHEAVLKELEAIGKIHFDIDATIKNYWAPAKKRVKTWLEIYKDVVNSDTATDEMKKHCAEEIQNAYNSYDLINTFNTYFSLGDCNRSEFDLLLLRRDGYEKILTGESKKAIETMMRISYALSWVGGRFVKCGYDTQETNIKEKLAIHHTIGKILAERNEIEKSWEGNDDEFEDGNE